MTETKATLLDAQGGQATNDNLTRKIQLLEEELDAAEKNVKETVEKCVPSLRRLCRALIGWQTSTGRCQGRAFRTSASAC